VLIRARDVVDFKEEPPMTRTTRGKGAREAEDPSREFTAAADYRGRGM